MLATVSEQQALYEKQSRSMLNKSQPIGSAGDIWSPKDLSPADNVVKKEASHPYEGDSKQDSSFEMLRLKQELDAVTSRLVIQEQELAQSRVMKHTLDQAMDSPSDADFTNYDLPDSTISSILHGSSAFSNNSRSLNASQDAWISQDDARSDVSDGTLGDYSRPNRGIWGSAILHNSNRSAHDPSLPAPAANDPRASWAASVAQSGYNPPAFPSPLSKGQGLNCPHQKSPPPTLTMDNRYFGDQASFIPGPSQSTRPLEVQGTGRAAIAAPGSYPPQSPAWGTFNSPVPTNPQIPKHTSNGAFLQGANGTVFPNQTYQPQPIGAHLGLPGADFAAGGNSSTCASWDTMVRMKLLRGTEFEVLTPGFVI